MKCTKSQFRKIVYLLLLSLFVAACSEKSVEPEMEMETEDTITDKFVGMWEVTAFEMIDKSDGSNIVDVLALIGDFSGTFEFDADGRYQWQFIDSGAVFDEESGSFSVSGDMLMLVPDDDSAITITYVFSNNDMTLQVVDEDSGFDFDGDSVDDPAVANITLQKSN